MTIFLLCMLVIVVLLLIETPVAFAFGFGALLFTFTTGNDISYLATHGFNLASGFALLALPLFILAGILMACCLYTSPSPRARQKSRMPSSA